MQLGTLRMPNDWPIGDLLLMSTVFQMAVWGILGLRVIGYEVGTIQLILGLVYLLVLPGFILMRALRIHPTGRVESLLYAVGLSLALEMMGGLLANAIFPYLGIRSPISAIPLLAVYTMIIVALQWIAFVRDSSRPAPVSPTLNVNGRVMASLALLPMLTIIGTYLENYYRVNSILIVVLVLAAALVIVIGFTEFVGPVHYSFATFVLSLSLLYHRSLISSNMWGWDVFHEFYLANTVVLAGSWIPSLAFNSTAMLSTVILAPAYSVILCISLVVVFKWVWPFLFSTIPVALFIALDRMIGSKFAFLPSFFFLSIYVFYSELPQIPRQEIAELFLSLIILSFFTSQPTRAAKMVLTVAFSLALLVSHYGTSYIFLGSLVVSCFLLFLQKHRRTQPMTGSRGRISTTYIGLLFAFAYLGYAYISSSTNFISLVQLGNHISTAFFSDLLTPQTSQPVGIILAGTQSPLHGISGGLQVLSQLLILAGLVAYWRGRTALRLDPRYAAMAGSSFIVLVASIVVPYFASALNTSRIYQLALFFLAPFLVVGTILTLAAARRFLRMIRRLSYTPAIGVTRALAVFLVIFLAFNSGLIYELTGDNPTSISLSNSVDFPRFGAEEVAGAQWLSELRGQRQIYADGYRYEIFLAYGVVPTNIPMNVSSIPDGSIIYLGKYNVGTNLFLILGNPIPASGPRYVSFDDKLSLYSEAYDAGA